MVAALDKFGHWHFTDLKADPLVDKPAIKLIEIEELVLALTHMYGEKELNVSSWKHADDL